MSLQERLRTRKTELIVISAILVYAAVFSAATIWKHSAYYSYAWDLGVFDQVMYNSVYGGRLFHYSCDGYMNVEQNYLAFHFSPILALIFPIYYLFPKAETLLVVKSAALAAAAYPLYLLAKRMTGNEELGLLASLAYLLYPGVQAANWFDFQPQVFAPLLLFQTYRMFYMKRWVPYLLSLGLTLIVEEHMFIVMAVVLAGHYAVGGLQRIRGLLNPAEKETQILAATIAMSLTVYILSVVSKSSYPISPEFMDVYQATESYRVLNYTGGGFQLPLYAARHPLRAAAALLHDVDLKFIYFLFLFAPLLFLPLMNRFFPVTLALYIPFYLSNYRAYYSLGAHYTLYLLPTVFISLLHTLSSHDAAEARRLCRYIVIVSTVTAAVLSPISPISEFVNQNQEILWYPPMSRLPHKTEALNTLLTQVPPGEAILTQNHVFPHVSNRVAAYVIPIIDFNPSLRPTVTAYIDSLVDRSDYVLIDYFVIDQWSLHAYEHVARSQDWCVQAVIDDAILFKRDMDAGTSIGVNRTLEYMAVGDLVQGGYGTVETPKHGTVAACPKGAAPGFIVYGPYSLLPPGTYEVAATVRVLEPEEGHIGYFQVVADRDTELARKDMWSHEYPDSQWTTVAVTFKLEKIAKMAEYRLYTEGRAEVQVAKVTVRALAAEAPAGSATWSITHRQLILGSCEVTPEQYIRGAGPEPVLWYGPYIHLEPGRYEAHFHLRAAAADAADPGGPVLTIDVSAGSGVDVLSSMRVYHWQLDGWTRLTLGFTLLAPSRVEFRGLYPAEGYEVLLAEVTLEPLLTEEEP